MRVKRAGRRTTKPKKNAGCRTWRTNVQKYRQRIKLKMNKSGLCKLNASKHNETEDVLSSYIHAQTIRRTYVKFNIFTSLNEVAKLRYINTWVGGIGVRERRNRCKVKGFYDIVLKYVHL